jgi:hypothetical protein
MVISEGEQELLHLLRRRFGQHGLGHAQAALEQGSDVPKGSGRLHLGSFRRRKQKKHLIKADSIVSKEVGRVGTDQLPYP